MSLKLDYLEIANIDNTNKMYVPNYTYKIYLMDIYCVCMQHYPETKLCIDL